MNHLSKRQRLTLLAIGTVALTLELIGVSTGAYHYGSYPMKLAGVPLSIPFSWMIVCALAYFISTKHGKIKGVLGAYSIDLILEPMALTLGFWTWTNPATTQIYFNSTVGNVVVWLLMLSLSVVMLGRIK